MRLRWRLLTGTTVALLASALVTGCHDGNSASTTTGTETPTGAWSVPTYAEVNQALTLDADDAAVVKSALAEWKQSASGSGETAPLGMRRGRMEFVAAVVPSLDDAQLSKLVDLLVARNEARREEMGGHFAEMRRRQRLDGRIDARLARIGEHLDEHAAWLDTVLDLSDTQAAQVKTALTTRSNESKASLKALKDGSITRDQRHERMRAAHEGLAASLEEILTEPQRARLQIVRPLLPHGPRRV